MFCTIFLLVERACFLFFLLQSKRGAQYTRMSTYIVNTVHTVFVHKVVFYTLYIPILFFQTFFFYSILNLLAFSHFFSSAQCTLHKLCSIDLVLIYQVLIDTHYQMALCCEVYISLNRLFSVLCTVTMLHGENTFIDS